jgi:hypothetical protein
MCRWFFLVVDGVLLAALSTTVSMPGKAQLMLPEEAVPMGREVEGARPEPDSSGGSSSTGTDDLANPTPAATTTARDIGTRSTLSGDWWGARTQLATRGVNLRLWATGCYQGQW